MYFDSGSRIEPWVDCPKIEIIEMQDPATPVAREGRKLWPKQIPTLWNICGVAWPHGSSFTFCSRQNVQRADSSHTEVEVAVTPKASVVEAAGGGR